MEISNDVRMLTIVPTRGRENNALRLLEAINATADFTELVFAIDDDELETYKNLINMIDGINNLKVVSAKRMGMNGTLNHWASWFAPDYDYICFMGDDHLPKTAGWDTLLVNSIGENPGIAYGNDLLQGQNLPTAVVISAGIVEAIGYMSPPELKHLFMDNFWLTIGERLNNANYLPEVIIEHLHYTNGKADHDERYAAVNTPEMHLHDEQIFKNYLATQITKDLELINAHFNNRS